jgi:hypothetical protein
LGDWYAVHGLQRVYQAIPGRDSKTVIVIVERKRPIGGAENEFYLSRVIGPYATHQLADVDYTALVEAKDAGTVYDVKELTTPPLIPDCSGWSTTPPSEPGRYWFYGDPWLGDMGSDFRDDYHGPDENHRKLHSVEIVAISNGVLAVADGNFMSLRTFDKKGKGHLGYWQKAETATPPKWEITL